MRAALLALGLVGCATYPPSLAQLDQMSNSRVCYLASAGGPQTSYNARVALERRGHACTPEDVQIEIARQQQASSNAAAAALLLNATRPQPSVAPMPAPVNCTTQYINGVAYTNCR